MSRPFIMAGQRGASELGFMPARLHHLVDALESEIERGRLPGAVALIARHGKLVLCESLGAQDPQQGVPMALDSIFRIYSMTKPIVSVATMMLVERGRLLLSDPVAKFIPEFKNLTVDSGEEGAAKPAKPATPTRATKKAAARKAPAKAAAVIVEAVEKNKRRALIGPDARVFDAMVRIAPTGYQRLITGVVRSRGAK